jgi:tRNA pseudouridine55 synthase
MYSAKKRAGRKLYELARRGEEIEREAVRVCIHELELIEGQPVKNNQDGTWDCRVRVVCSAGTYVRTLAEDFGKLMGLGAHVSELRRVRVGDFRIDTANSLEEVRRRVAAGSLSSILLPPDAALSTMPSMHLSMAEAERALRGVAVPMASEPGEAWVGGERVRLRDPKGNLVAIAVYDQARRLLRPHVVLVAENRR